MTTTVLSMMCVFFALQENKGMAQSIISGGKESAIARLFTTIITKMQVLVL